MKNVKFVFAIVLALALGFNNNILAQQAVLAAHIADDGGKKITTNGATIISQAHEGMVITLQNGKYGFANKQGVDVVFPTYEDAHQFSNNYAAVRTNAGWTFINKQGKKISRRTYDWVGSFGEMGYAPVQINGKWGFINEQGAEIAGIKYDKVAQFDKNGNAVVKIGENWFLLNENGVETPMDNADKTQQADIERLIKL